MDFVPLGSITRDRIVASARVMRHRQIPAIQQLSAITNRSGAAIDVQGVDAARTGSSWPAAMMWEDLLDD
jgi:hypothetical protein